LFLILWYIVLPIAPIVPQQTEIEEIQVSLGDSQFGGGTGNSDEPNVNIRQDKGTARPQEKVQPMAPATEKAPKSISKGAAKEVITQNNAEAAAIVAAQKKKDKEMKEAAENARIEKERVAAEQRRKEQRAIDNAKNVMNGAFSKNTQGTGGPGNGGNGIGNGSGNGTGNTHQGNPAGKGISNGNSWSLNGRGLMGKLAQPAYNKDISGKVTIDIRVDANGKVISTSIGKPTNISDAQILQSARNAAINTRFTAGKSEAVGSITYNFNLN